MIEQQARRVIALPPGEWQTDAVIGIHQLAVRLVQIKQREHTAIQADLHAIARHAAFKPVQTECFAQPYRGGRQTLIGQVVLAQADVKCGWRGSASSGRNTFPTG